MGVTTPEGERFVRESDIETVCTCASRTCGPHRCRLSVSAWVVVGVLLCYVLFMHSTFYAERQTLWTSWQTHWNEQANDQLTRTEHAMQDALSQRLSTEAAALHASDQEAKEALATLHQDVERLRLLLWVETTPQYEREMQLKTAVARIEGIVKEWRQTYPRP